MRNGVVSLREYKRTHAKGPAARIAAIASRQKERRASVAPVTRIEERKRAKAAAIEATRRFPDESELDHAKRLGLIGESRGGGTLYGCAYCADLPWRRRKSGCPGCGGSYRLERLEFELPTAQSSAGMWREK